MKQSLAMLRQGADSWKMTWWQPSSQKLQGLNYFKHMFSCSNGWLLTYHCFTFGEILQLEFHKMDKCGSRLSWNRHRMESDSILRHIYKKTQQFICFSHLNPEALVMGLIGLVRTHLFIVWQAALAHGLAWNSNFTNLWCIILELRLDKINK